ncbi:MAG TPA: response regulator, partial [Candidatus Vogelbacteria bacterium]|nr:response regulator [Candidatus Vogelbacteria bacterium]
KILIVDDDRFLVDMYSMKFANAGFEVLAYFSAEEVLKAVAEDNISPDICLIDIIMPNMDGFELIEKLKQEENFKSSLFVVLSNLGQKEDVNRGREYGLAGYIIKASATPAEVVKMISDLAEGKSISNNALA